MYMGFIDTWKGIPVKKCPLTVSSKALNARRRREWFGRPFVTPAIVLLKIKASCVRFLYPCHRYARYRGA